jgi:serine/threonine protein kinase/tetratricopeptide (TPR) repeat protein
MMPSIHISHYELLEPIGRDGATEIYRAHDTRLGRNVAVRLLRPEEVSRPEAIERFRREARIASLVNHPNICTVHDSGEEDGRPFLVLELLEGSALDEVMATSRLPSPRMIDIGIQLADALAAAHRRGIIHGSVKPSNVFITADGHVKVLELGAAAAAAPIRSDRSDGNAPDTTTASVAPSVSPSAGEFFHAYVSPEQISGTVDERSDVFAIGALVYEMATGSPAFTGQTAAELAAAIAERAPVRPRSVNGRVPAVLERIILRALEKDPSRRFQSAEDLKQSFCQARRSLDTAGLPLRSRAGWRPVNVFISSVAVLALIALASTGWWWGRNVQSHAVRHAILVSHIANGTADPDFDGTLRQAVTVYLGQSPFLELASDERVRATLELMGRDADTRMTHEIAAEVCERLALDAMLEGSVSAVGRSTVIALVASDCVTGGTIAREQVETEKKEDVLRALGRVTASMRESLGESGATLARHNVPLEEATTPSLEALKAYTDAVGRRAAGAESEAVTRLERAVAIDPQFALAYTSLSTIFGGFGETGRSEAYARLAYEHRSRVSERERFFITFQYHDRVTGDQLKAREALDVWKATYPRDYRPVNGLAVLLNRIGDYRQAAIEATEAIRRNPAHAFPRSNLAYAYRGAGRIDDAREVVDEALARKLETMPMRRLLYQLAEMQGDDVTARKQIDWAVGRPRAFDMIGARAQVAAYHGRMTEARGLYAESIAAANERGFRQVASGYASQAALTEAVYGFAGNAALGAREVLKIATSYEPQLRAASALALAGDPSGAEAVLHRLRRARPTDTLLQQAYLPSTRAAVLLAHGRFDAAADVLRPASTCERGMVAALLPTYLRGLARLSAGAYPDAIREFRAVIEQRGADPFSPLLPMSLRWLARAQAHAGARNDSVKAYEQFLRDWASADSVPVVLEARKELSQLVEHNQAAETKPR